MLYNSARLFGKYRTSAALYDRFVNHYQQVESDQPKKPYQEHMWDLARLALYHPCVPDAVPALQLLQSYAEHGSDAIASQETLAHKMLAMPLARLIRRTAEVAEATGDVDAAIWIFKTFEREFLMAKPMNLTHAKGQIKSLRAPPTPMQQRLFAAATRSGWLREKPRPETIQVQFSAADHAQKIQSMFT